MKSQKAFWLETSKFICIIPLCFLHTPVFAFPTPSALTQVNPKAAADELLQKGEQQSQAKQVEAAIISWKQSREMYRQLQEPQGESKALLNLGTAYLFLDRYQDAIATLEFSLPLTQSLNNRRDEAQALGNLGIAYNAMGNYSKAISSHKKAGKILFAIGDRQGLGQVLLNLGKTFAVLGDDDNAITAFEQSLKITQQKGDQKGEGIAQGNLGTVYANEGKYQEAITAHNQSLKIAQDIKNPSAQASALINLGSTYHSQRQGEKARSYYQQALEIAKSAGDRKRQAEALGSLGLVYEDDRNYTKAIEYQEQTLAITEKIGDPAFQGMALNNLGHALFRAGKLKAAEEKLRAAVKLLDGLRPGLSDTYKVSIFDTQVYTYNLLQQILVAANKPEAALEASEQGRARAYAELLSKRIYQEGNRQTTPTAISNLPPPNIEKIREIARQQNATLVEYAIVPDDDFKFRGKQRGREEELFIWVVQPTGKVALRRVDLKPLWGKGGTLANVIQISRCYILDQSAEMDECLNKPIDESQKLMQALHQLKPPQKGESFTKSQDFRQILHQFLIQAIVDLLPSNPNDHVIFIPQETLFLVPFPALQDKKGKYLIEQHTILTAPSIQLLELTHNLKDKRKQLAGRSQSLLSSSSSTLIVGNPIMPEGLGQLEHAEQEAKDIAELFNTTAIIGVQATKAQILQKISSSKLVHLATHGLLDHDHQNTSLGVPGAIALTPSGKDSGWLTANEIFNLRLNAELVVLSACETGKGIISGDGVIGLSRALITAGSLSVIVSLWSVNDNATANLMTVFYQSIQKNPDKAAALRHAMLETMKKQPQPFYWAAFTLMGEP